MVGPNQPRIRLDCVETACTVTSSDEDASRMKIILQVQQNADLTLAESSDIVVTKALVVFTHYSFAFPTL